MSLLEAPSSGPFVLQVAGIDLTLVFLASEAFQAFPLSTFLFRLQWELNLNLINSCLIKEGPGYYFHV